MERPQRLRYDARWLGAKANTDVRGIPMGRIWIGFGAVMLWMGWDAVGTLKTKRISSRDIAERA